VIGGGAQRSVSELEPGIGVAVPPRGPRLTATRRCGSRHATPPRRAALPERPTSLKAR